MACIRASLHRSVVDKLPLEVGGRDTTAAHRVRVAPRSCAAAHHLLHLRSQPPRFELQNAVKEKIPKVRLPVIRSSWCCFTPQPRITVATPELTGASAHETGASAHGSHRYDTGTTISSCGRLLTDSAPSSVTTTMSSMRAPQLPGK
jgi:hypothetical protein